MKVFFFNSNTDFFNNFHEKEYNCCAFWYTRGLTAYNGIETVIQISEIYIEESIANFFFDDYKYLTDQFKIVIFPGVTKQDIANPRYLFLASNDTIMYSFLQMLKTMPENTYSVYCKVGENARKTAIAENITAVETNGKIKNKSEFDLLVMGNDWGILEQNINYDFIAKQKNTVCIQESVIDFNIRDERMLHCSFPIYQGIATLKSINLNGKICAVIGNPRYEKLKTTSLPERSKY